MTRPYYPVKNQHCSYGHCSNLARYQCFSCSTPVCYEHIAAYAYQCQSMPVCFLHDISLVPYHYNESYLNNMLRDLHNLKISKKQRFNFESYIYLLSNIIVGYQQDVYELEHDFKMYNRLIEKKIFDRIELVKEQLKDEATFDQLQDDLIKIFTS